MTSKRKLRFAVVGTGSFGVSFTSYINEVAEVVAICEPSSARRSQYRQKTGLEVQEFDNYESLLAKAEIDAVAVTSPNHTHKEVSVAAANAGKHVFCEKAMATNVPDCWAMVRASRSNNVRLMVGHKRRLRPPWARMIALREQLGSVAAITACLYYDARPYDHKGWWTLENECGGLLDIAGVHTIDWTRAMCGDVMTVCAMNGPQIDPRYDFSDTIHTLLQFRSGAVATINVSLKYPLQRFRESVGAQVVCREGGMHLATYLDHIDLFWQTRNDEHTRLERFDDLGFDHAYRKELGDFVRWITEGTEPCLSWQEGLRCVEVIEAAHRSAKRGGEVINFPLYPELEDPSSMSAG